MLSLSLSLMRLPSLLRLLSRVAGLAPTAEQPQSALGADSVGAIFCWSPPRRAGVTCLIHTSDTTHTIYNITSVSRLLAFSLTHLNTLSLSFSSPLSLFQTPTYALPHLSHSLPHLSLSLLPLSHGTRLSRWLIGVIWLIHVCVCVLLCFINPILGNRHGPGASFVTCPLDVCTLIRIWHGVPCAESQRREYVTVQRLTKSNADTSMRQHHASHVLVQVRTNASCHTYDVNESCHLYNIDESCHMYALDSIYESTYNDVNMYTYIYLICASASRVAFKSVNESCQTGANWKFPIGANIHTSHLCVSVARRLSSCKSVDESCHTYNMNESHQRYD